MISDGPNTIDLAVGTDRRIIEIGDAQLTIPPVLLPVLLNIKPHTTAPQASVPLRGSALLRGQISRTNSAAFTLSIGTLDKGVWELEIILCSLFTAFIAATATFNGNEVTLSYNGIIIPLIKRIAFTGSHTDKSSIRLLLLSQAIVQVTVPITGIGETTDLDAVVNAVRIL